jgi:DNA-binding transcriptional ArsR family regulator
MSQPAISRHLKVLEGAGLISRRRRQTARLSHLKEASAGHDSSSATRTTGTEPARLDALLARLQADPTPPRPDEGDASTIGNRNP